MFPEFFLMFPKINKKFLEKLNYFSNWGDI